MDDHYTTWVDLILWSNCEWDKGNRVKASKLRKIASSLEIRRNKFFD